MNLFKTIIIGFLLGLSASLLTNSLYTPPTQVNYIDKGLYEDTELEKVILVDIPQDQ
jgi:hypothetical protein